MIWRESRPTTPGTSAGSPKRSRFDPVDQRLSHDEGVASARRNAVVLRLHTPERVEPALEVIELAQLLVRRRLVGPDLFLDAPEPLARVVGFDAAASRAISASIAAARAFANRRP